MEEKIVKITNVRQFDCLVELMERNPELAKGYYNFGSNKQEYVEMWNTFKNKLNSLGPPTRDLAGWQKVWSDYKGKIKKKLANNKKELAATGGGTNTQSTFSPLEESVISLLCFDTIYPSVAKKTFGLSATRPSSEAALGNHSSVRPTSEAVFIEDNFENYLPSTSTQYELIPNTNDVELHVAENSASLNEISSYVEVSAPFLAKHTVGKQTPKKQMEQNRERHRMLEIQTKSIQETEKHIKDCARYARKSFELQQTQFKAWRENQLDKKKYRKDIMELKVRTIEYKEKKLQLEAMRNSSNF